MAILVRNVRLGLEVPEDDLLQLAARRLKVPVSAVRRWCPVRRSLDARDKENIHFVYHVELSLEGGAKAERSRLRRLHARDVEVVRPRRHDSATPGERPLPERPAVVGFGPAGMLAALRLAEYGYRPIVLERGRDVRTRHRDVLKGFYRERRFNAESNLLYGEGGAGTYSDGKLYTRVSDPLARTVLELLVRDGADPGILVEARPHVGSDKLPTICRNIRRRIEAHGGEIRFGCRLDDIVTSDGRLTSIRVDGSALPVGPTILAIGLSARDTVRMLSRRGVRLAVKPFQIGVRIEHPQELVDRWQYGAAAGHDRLPPAEYRLVAKGAVSAGGDLFTFCMCPGGMILPTIESPGLIATNGASKSARRSGLANAGLVITMSPETFGNDPVTGLEYLERWERRAFACTGGTYAVPAQRAADFLAQRESDGSPETSYPLGAQWRSIREVIPPDVAVAVERGLRILDAKLPGFAGSQGLVTGPETRAGGPVRIVRDPTSRQSVSCEGLYPCGEGAGYAGGIVSAAIDGIQTADAIISEYAALEART